VLPPPPAGLRIQRERSGNDVEEVVAEVIGDHAIDEVGVELAEREERHRVRAAAQPERLVEAGDHPPLARRRGHRM